ncbi:DNA polymerase III, subunit gamma and tau [Candidatus Roizmanbacteria bacterium RIFOXYB2_FULL_41_10]|uniref:DNA polymerase III subunit gamma/tau n=1 Tax=Candidatus Roizmanbacteria bacterium RIFOXYA1_FULL_41_12 TaxID=1802082 RepID=A0A1F7KAP4_9BACT|nr:MAG: DNA polymerase III, subunit gamma and tau [Candidatus Roizmanbacteria bacterium RIFOXYA2_FULL_41_8]OGK64933.1 MAG: DNA polymerase III, subunit gamma and tau [Candidatus Roizmanbacteria bacterium RIFOXYA1_FULL_41_12]OGK66806.1 MAG: DNA polymerase III, subunit gamma and tau [Candidatus Roizmanbacteria bacterium RIFOXYB1_FULL_41_27]OGK70820.1 MAG: DNA polymerase III, subunit gamma and tau [Candidatus Roizmanbacteria bacterium RIFOXYC1_FULL_41_16]OGK71389.1 MAG: DNA polymerase III, subunit 
MYYLKYRPASLAEIDNQKRQEILTKIFQSSDLPHAFLFIGPKGTGKTSTARIIAKILNCEQNQGKKKLNPQSCNQCENCLAIAKNRFLDVYELDAASSRGIDDIRSLRDQVSYAPTRGAYKVYIIDEVHMLTKEAFNALLKTLEEPPSHVVFILATTESHKLPETIISRCLTVPFQKANLVEIRQSLLRIVKGEKLKVSEATLDLIAKSSQGSFRDAAKLLELAVSTTDLTEKAVSSLLKSNSQVEPEQFLKLVLAKQTAPALKFLQDYDSQGLDYSWLIEALLEELRVMLLIKKGLIDDSQIGSIINKTTLSEISRLMKILLEAYQLTKSSPIEALPLMIAVVEFAQEKV